MYQKIFTHLQIPYLSYNLGVFIFSFSFSFFLIILINNWKYDRKDSARRQRQTTSCRPDIRPDSFNAWCKVCHVLVVREVCFMPKGCEFFEGGKIVFIANKVNCNRRHVIGFKDSDRTMRDIDMAVSRKYSQHAWSVCKIKISGEALEKTSILSDL